MNAEAVGVGGPGDVELLGLHGLPHREGGVDVRRDLQQEERRAQHGDFGRTGWRSRH